EKYIKALKGSVCKTMRLGALVIYLRLIKRLFKFPIQSLRPELIEPVAGQPSACILAGEALRRVGLESWRISAATVPCRHTFCRAEPAKNRTPDPPPPPS